MPDGALVPGVPLTIAKMGGDITLSWDASCSPTDTDYGVYEGSIGVYYSHTERLCTTGGLVGVTLTPGAGDRYYLVVPRNAASEGSYGHTSDGDERPPGSSTCLSQLIDQCS